MYGEALAQNFMDGFVRVRFTIFWLRVKDTAELAVKFHDADVFHVIEVGIGPLCKITQV